MHIGTIHQICFGRTKVSKEMNFPTKLCMHGARRLVAKRLNDIKQKGALTKRGI